MKIGYNFDDEIDKCKNQGRNFKFPHFINENVIVNENGFVNVIVYPSDSNYIE